MPDKSSQKKYLRFFAEIVGFSAVFIGRSWRGIDFALGQSEAVKIDGSE